MLTLQLKLPNTITARQMVQQKNIPCVSRIGRSFEIVFEILEPAVYGLVETWDRQMVEERAPAGAGGRYTHLQSSLISLVPLSEDRYMIESLSMFYESMGWREVFADSGYAPLVPWWDEE